MEGAHRKPYISILTLSACADVRRGGQTLCLPALLYITRRVRVRVTRSLYECPNAELRTEQTALSREQTAKNNHEKVRREETRKHWVKPHSCVLCFVTVLLNVVVKPEISFKILVIFFTIRPS